MGRNECGAYHQLETVSILEGFSPGLWPSGRDLASVPKVGGCPTGTCPRCSLNLLKATHVLVTGLYWEWDLLSPSTFSPCAQFMQGAQRFCIKYSFEPKQGKPARLWAASGMLVSLVPGGHLRGWARMMDLVQETQIQSPRKLNDKKPSLPHSRPEVISSQGDFSSPRGF